MFAQFKFSCGVNLWQNILAMRAPVLLEANDSIRSKINTTNTAQLIPQGSIEAMGCSRAVDQGSTRGHCEKGAYGTGQSTHKSAIRCKGSLSPGVGKVGKPVRIIFMEDTMRRLTTSSTLLLLGVGITSMACDRPSADDTSSPPDLITDSGGAS